jgi:hypothetical protein
VLGEASVKIVKQEVLPFQVMLVLDLATELIHGRFCRKKVRRASCRKLDPVNAEPFRFEHGQSQIPDIPGNGIAWYEYAIERFACNGTELGGLRTSIAFLGILILWPPLRNS